MKPIVLASSSIYRKELLQKLNLKFITDAPNIDESPLNNEQPKHLAMRLAKEKAEAIQSKYNNHIIIASDQVASFNHHILGKPGSHSQSIQQLKLQSGQTVDFFTSICVIDSSSNESHSDIDICTVHFKELSEQQILNYLNFDKPYDCAGSFKSEGLGIALFDKIESEDPNTLIGLPLIKLIKLLNLFKIEII